MATAAHISASRNRLINGFRSSNPILPGDDPAEYEALLHDYTENFQPDGLVEQRYVREMVDAEWRLGRMRAYQQCILNRSIAAVAAENPDMDPIELQAHAFMEAHKRTPLAACMRYETQFQRQYDRAFNGLLSTRERIARDQLRESRAALNNCVAAPMPAPISIPRSVLPFEANPDAPPPLREDRLDVRHLHVGKT